MPVAAGVAGGRIYCLINAAGDVEPCVFNHYLEANIRDKSFLECLQQPLFRLYREGQSLRRGMETGGRAALDGGASITHSSPPADLSVRRGFY